MDTPSPATGITTALTGGDEVTARRQLVEPFGHSVIFGDQAAASGEGRARRRPMQSLSCLAQISPARISNRLVAIEMPLLIAARSWASKVKCDTSRNIWRIDCLIPSMSRSAFCIGVSGVPIATSERDGLEGEGS